MDKYVLYMFLLSAPEDPRAVGFSSMDSCWRYGEMFNAANPGITWLYHCITNERFRQEHPTMVIEGS
jgi:hypothetical protein